MLQQETVDDMDMALPQAQNSKHGEGKSSIEVWLMASLHAKLKQESREYITIR